MYKYINVQNTLFKEKKQEQQNPPFIKKIKVVFLKNAGVN